MNPALHPQFASSLERISFAVETMKSLLALFARAVRPTERSARPLAQQQQVYAYVGDLGGADFQHVRQKHAEMGHAVREQ